MNKINSYLSFTSGGSKEGEPSKNNAENDGLTNPEKTKNISFSTLEKVDCSSDSDSSTNVGSESSIDTPWTLQDDKILLEHLQKEYSEETFAVVSSLLKRSMGQVNLTFYLNLKIYFLYIF